MKKAKPDEINNLDFEYALRRALLNSDYFADSFFVRWQKRLGLNFKTVLWPATSITILIVGVIFLNTQPLTQESLNSQMSLLETTNTLLAGQNTSPLIEPREIFNNWYESGLIQYKGQEENGSRIYTVKIDEKTEVELMDPNPVIISLTSAP